MQTVNRETCSPCPPSSCCPTTGATPFDSALGAALIVAGAHSLESFTASSDTTGFWFLLVDKATAPVNGDVPIWSVFVPGASNVHQDFDCSPLKVTNGLAFAWSTTSAVVTLAALAGHVAVVGQYV